MTRDEGCGSGDAHGVGLSLSRRDLFKAMAAGLTVAGIEVRLVRGAARVDLSWKRGKHAEALLSSERGGKYNVILGDQAVDIELQALPASRLVEA